MKGLSVWRWACLGLVPAALILSSPPSLRAQVQLQRPLSEIRPDSSAIRQLFDSLAASPPTPDELEPVVGLSSRQAPEERLFFESITQGSRLPATRSARFTSDGEGGWVLRTIRTVEVR